MGIIAIIAWDFLTIFIVLMPIKYISIKMTGNNWLRVPAEEERIGLDIGQHLHLEDPEF